MSIIDKKESIEKIENEKSKVSVVYAIKRKTDEFTKQLFITLFDKNTDVRKGMDALEAQFKTLADLTCTEKNTLAGRSGQIL